MVDHDDEAFARLGGSDPATGSHPDLHSLRARIAAKAPASQGSDRVTAVTDDVLRGSRVRTPWIAAAAVAALGMGGGGYALGAHQAEPTTSVVAGESTGSGAGADSAGREPGSMFGASSDEASSADVAPSATEVPQAEDEGSSSRSGSSWDMGPVRLTAGPGLSDQPSTGEVRALVSDLDPDAFLADWAAELGLDTVAPQPEDGGSQWYGEHVLIEPDTFKVVSASVYGNGPLSFSYEDQLRSPYCADMYSGMDEEGLAMMREEMTKALGPGFTLPDPSQCVAVSDQAPSSEQGLAAAKDFLASTGLDVDSYTFEVPDYGESGSVMVEGWPSEGTRYGDLNVSVSVGPDGVYSAYGALGEMTSLGDYPVISAVEAVERYGQREFSVDYSVMIADDMNGWEGETSFPAPDYTAPEPVPVEPGMKIPLLLKDKVVTSAELTTGTIYTQTGGSLEVPTWKLITEDGLHYAVFAVADEAIDWQSWE